MTHSVKPEKKKVGGKFGTRGTEKNWWQGWGGCVKTGKVWGPLVSIIRNRAEPTNITGLDKPYFMASWESGKSNFETSQGLGGGDDF